MLDLLADRGHSLPADRQSCGAACLKPCSFSLAAQRAVQGVFEDDDNIHIVMELCLGGALMDRVKQVLPPPSDDEVVAGHPAD